MSMKLLSALAGGLAGACALTLLNEIGKKIDPEAPRLDILGMNALSMLLEKDEDKAPDRDQLYKWTMIGDLLSNSLYYSLAAAEKREQVWMRGILLGLGGGIGAIYLPKALNMDAAPVNRTRRTKAMTIAWYLAGGVIASAVINLLRYKGQK